MRRPAEAGLIAVSLLLVGCIGAELLWLWPGQVEVEALRPAPLRLAPDQPVQAAMHVDEWMGTVLARPLFSPDRRPPASGSARTGPAGTTLPRLSGVMTGPFGRTALFAAQDGGKPAAVKEGGTIGLFTVRTITTGRVVVSGPDGQRSLRPSFDPEDKDAAGAPPDAPPDTSGAAAAPAVADPSSVTSQDAPNGNASQETPTVNASQDAPNFQGQSPK